MTAVIALCFGRIDSVWQQLKMGLFGLLFSLYAVLGEKPILYCLLGAYRSPPDTTPSDETENRADS